MKVMGTTNLGRLNISLFFQSDPNKPQMSHSNLQNVLVIREFPLILNRKRNMAACTICFELKVLKEKNEMLIDLTLIMPTAFFLL